MPITQNTLYALAVTALGVFLCMLPFQTVPEANEKIALTVIGVLGGFIGGVAVGQAIAKSDSGKLTTTTVT